MKILLAASEIHPWSKTGGLADVTGALAKFLARAGHEIVVVTPLYAGIRERLPGLKLLKWRLNFPMRERMVRGEVWSLEAAENLRVLFVHQPELYQRAGLYGEKGEVYRDNADRFIFFSKAVANLARYLPLKPDIVHVHDWQTGLVPLMIRHQKGFYQWYDAPATCLTIHNLAYQGNFPWWDFGLTNLPFDYYQSGEVEFFGMMSCLKAGILFSDLITTVSPRYAREITGPELGCSMDGVLRTRQDAMFGILNGVDYEEWNTARNPFLARPYSAADLGGKRAQKAALQLELGLPQRAEVPLFGSITRLAEQKGLPIELAALEEMLPTGIQFVLLGSGDADLAAAFLDLARRHPEQVAVRIGFDQELSHRIEAGADFYLMPSRFEPCGLNQMYSLRYGTIPIVRATGGLDDSVVDATEDTDRADGVKFQEYSPRALAKAIRKALVLYGEPELLQHYRQNAMAADFSWERTVQKYEELYRRFAPARPAATEARRRLPGEPASTTGS